MDAATAPAREASASALAQLGSTLQAQTPTAETSPRVAESSRYGLLLQGAGEKAQFYFVQVKDGTVQLVGKVGGSFSAIRGAAGQKVHFYYVQIKDGVMQVVGKIEGSVSTLRDSAKTALEPRVEAFRPYVVKMQSGVADIVATIGNTPVVLRVKLSKVSGGIHSQFLKAVTAAQVKMQPLVDPIVNRVAPVWKDAASRVDCFTVSIKDGMLSIKGAVGSRVVHVTGKLSEIVGTLRTKATGGLSSVRTTISDFTAQLMEIVSNIYAKGNEQVQLLYTTCKDGVFEIGGQFQNQAFVLKAKVSDLKQLIQSTGKQLCNTSYADLKAKVHQASEIAKAKSLETRDNLRSLAANQKTQVTVASAAGGAVVLGAGGGAVGTGIGVVLAPFTLGLSIPVGLCLGTAAGGTAGLVTGGAAGYHKESIGNGVNAGFSKVKEYKSIAKASTSRLCTQVMASTGSTFA